LKYSLSCRQTDEYLKQADEIKFQYRDHKAIPDFIEKYPSARIDIALPYYDNEAIDWDAIRMYYGLAKKNLIIGVVSTEHINQAIKIGVDMYHRVPVHSFQELNDLQSAGIGEVYLGSPLFFQLDKVARYYPNMKIRAIANVALQEGSISYNDGVRGTWIRPEDVPTYEPYIQVIEFLAEKQPEQALFRIYALQHKWQGDMKMIISDLDNPAVNRMVPPTLAESRIHCGQRCMENGICHLCERTLDLANPDKWKEYLANTEDI
jgi:hypothetical protein